jgi:hypothetical protein
MTTQFFNRTPRYASLLGLLGLAGIAGVFNPELSRLSFLSFLSYLCYFRFLRWFAGPPQERTVASVLLPVLGAFLGALLLFSVPWLSSISPVFGFVGFAGFCGLYDSSSRPAQSPAA